MGVFEMDNATKYCFGSGVALHAPIPLHSTGQKMCFWIPGMGVFEMDNAKKILFGFRGGAPNTHTSAHHGPENMFLDTWDACVWTAQSKTILGASGVAPRTHIPLHIMGQKKCLWIPGMGVFEMDNATKY